MRATPVVRCWIRWSLRLSLTSASLCGAFTPPQRARAGEIELPRQVPAATLTQQVGLTEIGIEYETPAVRGRKIWGGLVPYDRPWTISSKPAAKIKFSRDVTVGDKLVPAGTYWLLATPGKAAWTFMLTKWAPVWAGARDYEPELDVARVKVQVKAAPRRERLAFFFSEISDDRAALDLEWDAVRVSLPIQVNTTRQIEAAIGGLDKTWLSFANAARYMLETKKDYDAGLKYVDEALALQRVERVQDWYTLWIKGALLAAKGQFGAATELAQSAYDLAHQTGSFDLEPDLLRSIADWKKRVRPDEERAAIATKAPPAAIEPPAARTAAKGEAPVATLAEPRAAKVEAPVASKLEPPAANAEPPAGSPNSEGKSEGTSPATLAKTSPVHADPPALRRARLRKR
jgi:hypothetical protein